MAAWPACRPTVGRRRETGKRIEVSGVVRPWCPHRRRHAFALYARKMRREWSQWLCAACRIRQVLTASVCRSPFLLPFRTPTLLPPSLPSSTVPLSLRSTTGDRLQRREPRAGQADGQGPHRQGARLHRVGRGADPGQRRQVRAAQPRHWRGPQDGLSAGLGSLACHLFPSAATLYRCREAATARQLLAARCLLRPSLPP